MIKRLVFLFFFVRERGIPNRPFFNKNFTIVNLGNLNNEPDIVSYYYSEVSISFFFFWRGRQVGYFLQSMLFPIFKFCLIYFKSLSNLFFNVVSLSYLFFEVCFTVNVYLQQEWADWRPVPSRQLHVQS